MLDTGAKHAASASADAGVPLPPRSRPCGGGVRSALLDAMYRTCASSSAWSGCGGGARELGGPNDCAPPRTCKHGGVGCAREHG